MSNEELLKDLKRIVSINKSTLLIRPIKTGKKEGSVTKIKLPDTMPPLGTPEYDEWLKRQQELANKQ